ncbi:hypothetical protein LTR91_020912 [Friedmanniomyces endolithicus]|uniref:Uncharacterized protein n=1 Tax=Friedmanniomyces endolithicus TaxID=329885 RepID=A0AAN6H7S7_9PEZI|nr:hypothetical protein LTR94_009577 [Friedmanniomyces endolithicus]KAK0795992.1 hypothetical protein LTR38_008713 [Friedmanniomyces endolithicus]KAK0804226.1 hypothetical protein LTR75_007747 [Friedmanniomyces endolithicus]KAK0868817.1 hypothetical protein LTS02_003443 [Friedmanniomyces endolithicus]KAK0879419.1 hypothetical protein LTR87_006802 [Friedmanniomyces endolithicus]
MQTRSAFAANGGGQKLAGQKRKAANESSLNDDQRFTKRFNLLSIVANAAGNGNSNLYIPVNNPAAAQNNGPPPSPDAQNHDRQNDEHMQVDDTRTRVYIHDLDEELADLDSENETLIFLPDIEQRLSKLPRQLLQHHRADEPLENQELVLYSTPKSLTVDEGHDVVRKAIIEARQRAQEKALEEATRVRQEDMNRKYDYGGDVGGLAEVAHGYSAVGYEEDEEVDPDAMDMG